MGDQTIEVTRLCWGYAVQRSIALLKNNNKHDQRSVDLNLYTNTDNPTQTVSDYSSRIILLSRSLYNTD